MSPEALSTLLGGGLALLITLLVFSRLVGDNPAFRVVQYLFVGMSLGYAFVVIYHQVLRPHALAILGDLGQPASLGLRLAPFLIGLLLLTRLTGRQALSWLANIPLALLFGVGAALALGGALVGTLLPQILDTARPLGATPSELIGGLLLALGVVLGLTAFYFTVPRETARGRVVQLGARAGRWLLIVAFGFFLAGSMLTYLAALNQRLDAIVSLFL